MLFLLVLSGKRQQLEQNLNFAYRLRREVKRDIFSHQDLKALLYPMSDAAINSGVARSLKSNDFQRLKRGLFLFSKNLRKGSISRLLIANKLYGPSYVSYESALSYHGLIPEAVYTTTSACFQRKNKTFSNELGDFSYDYIPSNPFFMGVINKKEEGGVLIATGLKALFDLIYIRRKSYHSIEELEDDLRIEKSLLQSEVSHFSSFEIETLAKSYKKKNVYQFYLMLVRTFK
jgi:predicted transcriptional regulator of viral defense system